MGLGLWVGMGLCVKGLRVMSVDKGRTGLGQGGG